MLFSIPTNGVQGFQLLNILVSICCFLFSDSSNGCEVVPHCEQPVLIISPLGQDGSFISSVIKTHIQISCYRDQKKEGPR